MARKFSLRSGGGRGRLHKKLSGAFGSLMKIWHPSEIYVTFSSNVLMTMVFLTTNFSSFTMQTPQKTQISLMAAINRSTSMRTLPDIQDLLEPRENAISKVLIPAITRRT